MQRCFYESSPTLLTQGTETHLLYRPHGQRQVIRRPSWEQSTSDASHCSFFGYFSSITILLYQIIPWFIIFFPSEKSSISLNLMYTFSLRIAQCLKSQRTSGQRRLIRNGHLQQDLKLCVFAQINHISIIPDHISVLKILAYGEFFAAFEFQFSLVSLFLISCYIIDSKHSK